MNGQERFQAELGQIRNYCQEVVNNFDSEVESVEKVHEVCSSLRGMVGRLFCVAEELDDYLSGGFTISEEIQSDGKPLFDYINSFRRKSVYYDLLIFDEAVQELKRVLDESTDPHVIAAAYNGLGHLYAVKKMYPQAIYYFNKVVEFYPDNSDGYFNLGAAWFNLGSYDEARHYFHQAIYHHPDDWEAYFHLGRAYDKLGIVDSAMYYMQTAREKKYGFTGSVLVSG